MGLTIGAEAEQPFMTQFLRVTVMNHDKAPKYNTGASPAGKVMTTSRIEFQ
jgi:hypothetical protein